MRLRREQPSPTVVRLDVISATELLVPAIEIVDSRIRDWNLTGPTGIADNALAARLLIGDRIAASDVDLIREGLEVLIDGTRRATGTSAAVLGHPADAVAWLRRCTRRIIYEIETETKN